ncbi:MAG: glycosyltransferase involved in cell wall biosynthesis [Bacteroidia bacterium]
MSLRILQVSNRVPYPLNEGGTIGIYNYTRGFAEAGCTVTLCALAAKKHQINEKETREALEPYCTLHLFPIDTDVKPISAFLNLFTKKSYNVQRFYSPAFEHFLINHLQEHTYDVIQIEGTFPALYTPTILKHSSAKVVLRQHNVEFQIWDRLAANTTNPIKAWYLRLLSARLKRFESKHLNQFAALVPVTPDDAELFKKMGCIIPIFPSPAGIDINKWKPNYEQEQALTSFHMGSLEWLPNLEAVEWLLSDIWPKVLEVEPKAKLFIAGKHTPARLQKAHHPGVVMMGEVGNAQTFISDKSLSLVPLKSGSGIRLKILESMSAGKLVISTSIGAQGIDYTDQLNIVIADTTENFSNAILGAMRSTKTKKIKQEGRLLIEQKYANEAVIKRLLYFYKGL